jgi:SPP1 family predicted phage head-tail adaptor
MPSRFVPAIGHLRERVTLQTPTRTADGAGGYTETWANLAPATVWAAVEAAPAAEVERRLGAEVTAGLVFRVKLRAHSGVTTRTRVTWGTRVLHVKGLETPDRLGRWLTLYCEELT